MTNYAFKVILVGDYGVGKSTSIYRFVENKFKGSYVPTLGVQITKKTVKFEENTIELLIWDLAGQDRYAMVRQRFYTDTEGIFMLYDITRMSSLEHIKKWHIEVTKYSKPVPIVLIGNKIDLEDKREVTNDDVDKYLEEKNIKVQFRIETSAKEGVKTEEAFHFMVKTIMQKYAQVW